MKSSSKAVGLVAIVLAAVGFTYWNTKTTTTNTNNPGQTPATNTPVGTNPVTTKYKDGTYSTQANYFAPSGQESYGLTLTILGDKITAAAFENRGINATSKNFQNKFISNINSKIVGASLDNLNISVVSGASLTSAGFNEALKTIRSQALN